MSVKVSDKTISELCTLMRPRPGLLLADIVYIPGKHSLNTMLIACNDQRFTKRKQILYSNVYVPSGETGLMKPYDATRKLLSSTQLDILRVTYAGRTYIWYGHIRVGVVFKVRHSACAHLKTTYIIGL